MTDKQALELTVLWQQANDLLDQMQAAIAGGEHNRAIQEIEAIREHLGDVVSQATSADDWGDMIPIHGEVHPDEARQCEAEINEYEMWGRMRGSRPRGPWL
jgi:hypothetical protein